MAPSNPSMLSPSSSSAGTVTSPPAQALAQGSLKGNYTMITSRTNSSGPGRSGRWTPDEKLLFLHGLKLHGRGRWKKIRQFLPTRYVSVWWCTRVVVCYYVMSQHSRLQGGTWKSPVATYHETSIMVRCTLASCLIHVCTVTTLPYWNSHVNPRPER